VFLESVNSTAFRHLTQLAGDGDGACFSLTFWSLTARCLVYNTAMYTVYGRYGQYGQCMLHTLVGVVWCGRCVVYTDP